MSDVREIVSPVLAWNNQKSIEEDVEPLAADQVARMNARAALDQAIHSLLVVPSEADVPEAGDGVEGPAW